LRDGFSREFWRGYADAGVTFAPRGNSYRNTVSADSEDAGAPGEMHRYDIADL
jgi:hypothetical protein